MLTSRICQFQAGCITSGCIRGPAESKHKEISGRQGHRGLVLGLVALYEGGERADKVSNDSRALASGPNPTHAGLIRGLFRLSAGRESEGALREEVNPPNREEAQLVWNLPDGGLLTVLYSCNKHFFTQRVYKLKNNLN